MTSANQIRKNSDDLCVNLARNVWHFSQVFEQLLDRVDTSEAYEYVNQLRWFLDNIHLTLERAGIRVSAVKGALYEAGDSLNALNEDEFGPDEELIVEQIIEPVIYNGKTLARPGAVLLRRMRQDTA